MENQTIYVGIDVGSTTTKIAVVDAESYQIIYSSYQRHNAAQVRSIAEALEPVREQFPDAFIHLALTGSGSQKLAGRLGIPYVQEVVANSIAIRRLYHHVGTAIELGGQDAKIIFFSTDPETGRLNVSDMRMNGSCAGGTGAFLDEVASILKVSPERLNELAAAGDCTYDISGRCGVYAKTDIQPLLNQGVSRENLALSSFHAVAKQTIGGLAQGLDISRPVIFEGGPLTFNPTLVRVFKERLGLTDEEAILPDRPEIMVAYGAALSLSELYADTPSMFALPDLMTRLHAVANEKNLAGTQTGPRYFESEEACLAYRKERELPSCLPVPLHAGQHVKAWLGIDCGSTTTKFVLMDNDENILDSFYASNAGEPIDVARNALLALRNRYRDAHATLEILGVGTTGYGEQLFARAFSAEYHVVETVAHARAAAKYLPGATFILDIGGQDMKAIWLDNGIITNIVVNEACSSGCGSFLENFAASLHIPVQQIADEAFRSQAPAALGSRCTVFMNSSIVTAQRNGSLPGDIMAGLCRSIIENVFTKVIRVSNLDSLGDRIVVQGGTFQNDAVLRAMEQYLGRPVTRAPYPGIMGAIGAALLVKESRPAVRTFIGLDALENFAYTRQSNSICPFCTNHCRRSVVTFPNGNSWVTNNRCERGEVLGDPKDDAVRAAAQARIRQREQVPNLFRLREKLLFRPQKVTPVEPDKGVTIGLPRVLYYWDTAPFWSAFWSSLGYHVRFSRPSTRKLYESGLSAVTSDTVCFPAKLVHGHIRDLVSSRVDRIFMPSITTVRSENKEKTSESMCAIVKGYPITIRNSDDPERRWGIPFDAPLFHWYSDNDRDRQLCGYMKDAFGIVPDHTMAAIRAGDAAQNAFRSGMKQAGRKVLEQVEREDRYAVVLASRPYQNDDLVNHGLPDLFAGMGIPVLTADSLPGSEKVDLHNSTLDIVNNFHARMLSTAIMAAQSKHLEYVQIVSFGCGHDAYLSDEIIRLMREISGKPPLVLKLDESDIQGPLRIRVRSFVETLQMRRKREEDPAVHKLPEPYPVKFTRADRKEKIVLVPNTSHAFSRIMAAAMSGQGLKAVPLELGREDAIYYGKQYVHNDICFPAQIVVGEALAVLKSGKYDPDNVAIAMGKYVGDCRLTHYSRLLRKALDDAGFPQVPILTNDDVDCHDQHPGFKMNLFTSAKIAFALPMIDALENLLRKIRPYELQAGSANAAFESGMDALIDGMIRGGINGMNRGFEKAIGLMKNVLYDRSVRKPQVLIVGEYLLNFHPGANRDIEAYLEKNGLEIIEAQMSDVIQKTYFFRDAQIREYHLDKPLKEKAWYRLANRLFAMAHDNADRIAAVHPLYSPAVRMNRLVKDSDPIIHHTFDTGEGVLIPAEILHHAAEGCRAFVILQPFGCLPNHIVGRGITRKLKELYPDAQILPLDYDPDVSFANIENRLQMLIMNVRGQTGKV